MNVCRECKYYNECGESNRKEKCDGFEKINKRKEKKNDKKVLRHFKN